MTWHQIRSLSHKRRITGGGYTDKVLAYGPLVYYPLYETSGTNAANLGSLGSAADGTYTGPTLNNAIGPDGKHGAPLFDGTNDYINIYSAALAAAFDGDEGTIMIWQKVYNAGVWTDGQYHFSLQLGMDSYNRLQLNKSNAAANNELASTRKGSNVTRASTTAVTPTAWHHHALTYSLTADEQRAYYAGSQYDTTLTTLGAWSGTLADGWCYISAYNGPQFHWYGWLAHAAVFDYALTPAQIAALAVT